VGDFEGIFAGLFGGVEGLVGPAGDFVGGVVGVVLADAYTDGYGNLLFVDGNGGACDDCDHTLGDDGGIAKGGIVQDNGELIAAIAGSGINLANGFLDAYADFLDDLIAGAVAIVVVDMLEIVDIDHNH
jgi:hypothetical protein